MKIYVTPPLANLELIKIGDRAFCLAQHYIGNEQYRKFFKELKAEGWFITMDSGVGDHDPVSGKDLMWAVKDLMPAEAIPRDVLDDSDATLKNLQTFIDNKPAGVSILACPQGKTIGSYIDCFKEMMFNTYVTRVAMSKLSTVKALYDRYDDVLIDDGRSKMFSILHIAELIHKPIHLLGMGTPRGLMRYLSRVQSVDSCAPIWTAMNGQKYSPAQADRIPTPRDYFERTVNEEQVQLAMKNVNYLKSDPKLRSYMGWCYYGYPEDKPKESVTQTSLF